MPRYIPFLAALFLVSLALPAAASADTARVTATLRMRAGPSTKFPVVATINDGARVRVHGCVRGYSWCDVSWAGSRGWVDADYLTYPYHNSYVPIVDYGAEIDLPIIVFSVDTYWDDYYRGRPWYHRRHYWHDYWRHHHHYRHRRHHHHRAVHHRHHHRAVHHRHHRHHHHAVHHRHHRFHRRHFRSHHHHAIRHHHRRNVHHGRHHVRHFRGHPNISHHRGGGHHFAHRGGGGHDGGHHGHGGRRHR